MNIASSHSLRPLIWAAACARARASDPVVVVVAALLMAAASQCSVHLGATPVPLSAQPQMVLGLAALLGPKRAPAAVITWLSMAVAGLPVLAHGATGAALFGPTAGYLLSYLPATWLVARYGRSTGWRGLLAWQAAGAVILAGGAASLSLWLGARGALVAGVAPFVWADMVKMSAAFLMYRGVRCARAWWQARR